MAVLLRCSIIVLLILLAPLVVTPATADQSPDAEVRILVDVSASMLRTDPDNLRRPALRLTSELLPEDTRAGVWDFADDVNAIVDVAAVDQQWRDTTRGAARWIHSMGQGTDIGAALETAAADWFAAPPSDDPAPRHLVLFTDGKVNISDDPQEDQAERQRIMGPLMDRLVEHGVTVHAVGLSDEIDQELMEALSRRTGGRMAVTRQAGELERLFLGLFDQVAQRDSLPMDRNRFQVDDTVAELTVVAFHDGDAEGVRLRDPDGDTLDESMAGDRVRWRSEPHHDLITIDQPPPGEWELLGAEDPDNRVMIVTDLRLHTDDLPAYSISGESFAVGAYLTEADEPITRDGFLDLTRFRLLDDTGEARALERDGESGRFATTVTPEAGAREFVVRVSSDTFRREARHRLEVLDTPLTMEREGLEEHPELQRRLIFRPVSDAIDPQALEVELTLTAESGSEQRLRVSHNDDAEHWDISLDTLDPHQTFGIRADAIGTMPDGRTFRAAIDSFETAGLDAGADDSEAAGPNVAVLATLLVVFNLILFAVIGLIFYLLQQRRTTPPALSGDDADANDLRENA